MIPAGCVKEPGSQGQPESQQVSPASGIVKILILRPGVQDSVIGQQLNVSGLQVHVQIHSRLRGDSFVGVEQFFFQSGKWRYIRVSYHGVKVVCVIESAQFALGITTGLHRQAAARRVDLFVANV